MGGLYALPYQTSQLVLVQKTHVFTDHIQHTMVHKISGSRNAPKEVPQFRRQFVGKGGKFPMSLIVLRLPDFVIFILFAEFIDSLSAFQIGHNESPHIHNI